MQCRRMCYKLGYPWFVKYCRQGKKKIIIILRVTYRRQQDKDREIRCTCTSYSTGTIKRHACPAQRNGRVTEHDSFWYVWPHVMTSLSPHVLRTFADENRQQLVNAGAIPVLVSLLNSPDTDVQYYCTTALSNIAVDG
jgi:hypothetical protein